MRHVSALALIVLVLGLVPALAVSPALAAYYAWTGYLGGNTDWFGLIYVGGDPTQPMTNWWPLYWPATPSDMAKIGFAGAVVDLYSPVTIDTLYIGHAAATLRIHDVMLTAASAANLGTLTLENIGGAANSGLAVSGELWNYGTINLNPGTGGERILNGALGAIFNYGAINVRATTRVAGQVHNAGTLDATGGFLMVSAGSQFEQASGGVLTGNGVHLDRSHFYWANGSILGRVVLENSTLAIIVPDGGGSSEFACVQCELKTDIPANTNVRVARLDSSGGINTLTVPSAVTNNGRLTLESGAYVMGILKIGADGAGTLTNWGTITSEGLAYGHIINNGTVQCSDAHFTGTVTNKANFAVGADEWATLEAGSVFNQDAGTLTVNGSGQFYMVQGTFNYNAGSVTGPVRLKNSSLSTTVADGGGAVFALDGNCALIGNLSAGVTAYVAAGTAGQPGATLTTDAAATSHGTITLWSVSGTYDSNLKIGSDGTGTLTNHGTMNSDPGGGGGRTVTGNLINTGSGRINVNANTDFVGSITNSGTFTVGNGQAAWLIGGRTFSQEGGALTCDGVLWVQDNGAFNFNGGVIGGTVTIGLNDSILSTAVADGGGAAFTLIGYCTLSGDLAHGVTAYVSGQDHGHARLTTGPLASNSGTITLLTAIGTWNSDLMIGSPGTGTLTNHGAIGTLPGSGGGRKITGNLTNAPDGTVNVDAPTDFAGVVNNAGTFTVAAGQEARLLSGSAFNQNDGSLTAGAGGSLRVDSGTFNFNGGAVTGCVQLVNSLLTTGVADGTGSLFEFHGPDCRLTGDVPPGAAVLIAGGGALADYTYLTTGALTTNYGTVTLESLGPWGAWLWADAGSGPGSGALVNPGTIRSMPGLGGERDIAAHLANSGTVDIQTTTWFTDVTNTGAFTVADGQDVDVQTFTQNAGTLTLTGAAKMHLTSGAFAFHGGTVAGWVEMALSTLTTTVSDATGATFEFTGACNLNGDIPVGMVARVSGDDLLGGTALTTGQAAANRGTLTLQSVSGACKSDLVIGDGMGTLTNHGALNSDLGTGGQRTITGSLVNMDAGIVNIHYNATVTGDITNYGTINLEPLNAKADAKLWIGATGERTLTNEGTFNSNLGEGGAVRAVWGNILNGYPGAINVNASAGFEGGITNFGAFTVPAGSVAGIVKSTFNQNAGSLLLAADGSFLMENGAFNFNGGVVVGPVWLVDSTLSTTVPDGGGAIFRLFRDCRLVGNLSSGVDARVQGGLFGGDATLEADDGAVNSGTLTLENVTITFNSNLRIGPAGAGTLTNPGAILALPGTGGAQNIEGHLINAATFYDSGRCNLYGNLTNQGAVQVMEGAELWVKNDHGVTQDSGTFTIAPGGRTGIAGALTLLKADSQVTVDRGTLSAGRLVGAAGSVGITDPPGGIALTVGSEESGLFSGILADGPAGAGSLEKIGTGMQTLAGPGITYTGTTTVTAGKLELKDASGFASTITNNAALEMEATAGTWAFGKAIDGGGRLEKSGGGTLVLSAANSYTGGTTVSEGTLLVENAAGSGTGTGTVTVGAATLGGTGFISGPVTLTGDSTLTSTGTLTLSNTLTISGDANHANQLPSGTILTGGNVTIDSGAVFIINGTLGGAGALIVRGTLMGKGTIGKAVSIEAGGTFSPGSPSTILTVGQVLAAETPQAFSFEIGGPTPDYASPSSSVNDVLRLTSATLPFANAAGDAPASLTADTVIDVYFLFNDPPGGEYKAEFFAGTDYSDAIADATFQYWRLDPRGQRLHNSNFFSPLDESLVDWSVVPETAAFGGIEAGGYITAFTVVPEPATLALLAGGGLALLRPGRAARLRARRVRLRLRIPAAAARPIG